MTEGSPGGSLAVLGVEVPVGAAGGEPATVGGADEPFGREPTDAEGRWAVQAVVRHASARATRLRPDRFVTVRPPVMSPTCVGSPHAGMSPGKPESRCSGLTSPGLSP